MDAHGNYKPRKNLHKVDSLNKVQFLLHLNFVLQTCLFR